MIFWQEKLWRHQTNHIHNHPKNISVISKSQRLWFIWLWTMKRPIRRGPLRLYDTTLDLWREEKWRPLIQQQYLTISSWYESIFFCLEETEVQQHRRQRHKVAPASHLTPVGGDELFQDGGGLKVTWMFPSSSSSSSSSFYTFSAFLQIEDETTCTKTSELHVVAPVLIFIFRGKQNRTEPSVNIFLFSAFLLRWISEIVVVWRSFNSRKKKIKWISASCFHVQCWILNSLVI